MKRAGRYVLIFLAGAGAIAARDLLHGLTSSIVAGALTATMIALLILPLSRRSWKHYRTPVAISWVAIMALFVLAGGKGARLDVEPGPATLLVVTGLMVGLAVLLVRRFPPAE